MSADHDHHDPGGAGTRRRWVTVSDWRDAAVRLIAPPLTHGAPGLTADGRLKSGRLKGLALGAAVWVLAWPVLLESLLNWCVGATDTVLAAKLGVDEMDAIGSAAYIQWFIGLVIMALGVGATALVARSVGRGRLAIANAAVGQTILLAAVSGVATGAFVAVASHLIAPHLTNTERAADAFRQYMWIVSASAPMASVLFCAIACARGAGDSVTPLWAMAVVNAVNILASWAASGVDIAGVRNPFPFDLGVAGIALGTAAGHVVGAGILLAVLLRGTGSVALYRKRLRPHWHTMTRLVRTGLPNFIETLGMWAGNFMVLMMATWLSASPGLIGAHTITIRLEAFSFLPGFAMGTAAATLAGQYLGAGSPAMARRAVAVCTLAGAGFMGLIGTVFLLFPTELVSMVSDQPEHLAHTPHLLRMCGAVQLPFGIALVVRGALRGAGDTTAAMWITNIMTYGARLPLAYALSGVDIPLGDGRVFENPFVQTPTLAGLWFAMLAELVLRCIVFYARFAQGKWVSARV